jgi:hypothetical protein
MKEVYDINKDISSATRIAVLQACLRSGISYMTQPSGAATCIRGRADAGGGRQVIRLAGRRPGKHTKRLANFNYPRFNFFFYLQKWFSNIILQYVVPCSHGCVCSKKSFFKASPLQF